MTTSWRTVRVFVSSTFRDMHQEREELVKRIFPQLRKLCESRGVTWGEVDLRWGVTDEQKAEGKVLPICLEEIKRCRPYFIGLLGERYGWIPNTISPEVIKREPWLKKHVQERKSVTELEILHGVLNDPEMANRACFYIRDPAYIDKVPAERKDDFIERDPLAQRKLTKLKDKIRSSGLAVHENYPDPKKLGQLVLEDLTTVINQEFPPETIPEPLDIEVAEHEAFARSRASVYIGRKEYFEKLDKHTTCDGLPLLILGESGCGKSAILANWVLKHRQASPDDLLIIHFIGASAHSADWANMVRRIMGELKRKFDIRQDMPDKPDELRQAFANWLHMAAAKGKVILILDGLNQLEDKDGAPDLVWLPPVIPANVSLIVSTLPGRALDELKKRNWPVLQVDLLNIDERRKLIAEYLGQYRKSLIEKRIDRIASSQQTANPLYLRALLEELRLFGRYEELDERIDYYLSAKTIPSLYEKILERYEQDYQRERPGLVKEATSLIWASRKGLSEAELLEMLGKDGEPLPRAYWSPLYLTAEQSFINRSGLINFSHEFLRQTVRHKFIKSQKGANSVHLRIADYFGRGKYDIKRTIEELPWQLAEANEWKRLARLLSHPKLISAIFSLSHYEAKQYWRLIEKNTDIKISDIYSGVIQEPERFLNEAITISDILDETSYPDEAIILLEKLLNTYQARNDPIGETMCLSRIGLLDLKKGNINKAREAFQKHRKIGERLGDTHSIQSALHNLSLVYEDEGSLQESLKLINQAIELGQKSMDKRGQCIGLKQKAKLLRRLGQTNEASSLLHDAFILAQQLGDNDIVQQILLSRSALCYQMGNLKESKLLNERRQKICREEGDIAGLADSLNHMGLLCKSQGKLQDALSYQNEATTIFRKLGSKISLASALGNQAETLIRMREFEKANKYNEESIEIYQNLGTLDELSISMINKAIIFLACDELDESLRVAKEAEQLACTVQSPEGIGRSLVLQAQIQELNGNYKEAKNLINSAIEELSKASVQEGLTVAYAFRGELLSRHFGQRKEALADFDKSIEIAEESGFQQIAMRTLSKIIDIYGNYNDYEVALVAAKELRQKAKAFGDQKEYIIASLASCDFLCRLGNFEEAQSIGERALLDAQKIQNDALYATGLFSLSIVLREQGNINKSLEYLDKALITYQDLQNWNLIVRCIIMKAQILTFDFQQNKKGIMILNEAIEICNRNKLTDQEKEVLNIRKSIEQQMR